MLNVLDSPFDIEELFRLQIATKGKIAVQTFKITYLDETTETVMAVGYADVAGTWIDFTDGSGQVLRVMAAMVARVERAKA